MHQKFTEIVNNNTIGYLLRGIRPSQIGTEVGIFSLCIILYFLVHELHDHKVCLKKLKNMKLVECKGEKPHNLVNITNH